MPLAIVSRVAFGADAANSKGAMRRRLAVPAPRAVAPSATPAVPSQEAPADDIDDDADDASPSTAGLSILAQALAAYSQN